MYTVQEGTRHGQLLHGEDAKNEDDDYKDDVGDDDDDDDGDDDDDESYASNILTQLVVVMVSMMTLQSEQRLDVACSCSLEWWHKAGEL